MSEVLIVAGKSLKVYLFSLVWKFGLVDEVVVSCNVRYVEKLDALVGLLVKAFGVVVKSSVERRVVVDGSKFLVKEVVLVKNG